MARGGASGLADFEGVWRITREIADRKGPGGRFEGRAVFCRDGKGLAYSEEGVLTLDGQAPVAAARRYLWRPAGPGRIAVAFPDGRPFHDFALDPEAEAEHRCDPDLYRVAYDFSAWPDWSAAWRVTGPRKDYRLLSRYRRDA